MLTLLGACLGVVLLSRTALLWVSAPIIPLIRAASAGPDVLTAALPRLAIHTAVWSGVVAGAYAWMRRYRP